MSALPVRICCVRGKVMFLGSIFITLLMKIFKAPRTHNSAYGKKSSLLSQIFKYNLSSNSNEVHKANLLKWNSDSIDTVHKHSAAFPLDRRVP